MQSKKERSYKEGIYFCLQQFEVDDIDLRRAPTGGWHGTYMNKLAYGINDADSKSSSSEETFSIESSDDSYSSGGEDIDDDVENDIENGAVANSNNVAVEEKFKKANSLFASATSSIDYHGLSKVENDDSMNFQDEKFGNRPWRMADDTI
jgi:hypothetical protein